MAEEKARVVVLCIQDNSGQEIGALAVSQDNQLNVTSVKGEFLDCFLELSSSFEVIDDSESVDTVIEALRASEFEAFDSESLHYDPTTGTSIRRLVRYVAGKLEGEPVGYVRFEPGEISGVIARFEEALPGPPREKAERRLGGRKFS